MKLVIKVFYLFILGGIGIMIGNTHPCFAMPTNIEQGAKELLESWKGPLGGVPPWDKVNPSSFPLAFEMAMDLYRNEIQKIKENKEEPNFQNVHETMQLSGQTLSRLTSIWGVYTDNLSNEHIQKMELDIAPKLSALSDEIIMDNDLFQKFKHVYDKREELNLTPEQKRIVELEYLDFVKNGSLLSKEEKEEVSKINQQLSTLFSTFNVKVLADEGKWIEICNIHELDGISPDVIESMANNAKEKNVKCPWIVLNTRSSVEPVLSFANNRELRKKVWDAFIHRGDNKDENDTNEIISQILSLRHKRAKLLGFKNHAHFRMNKTMAKDPKKAMDLMMQVWPKALLAVKAEVEQMQAIADSLGDKIKIEGYDYRYYAQKVKKLKFDLDENEIRPYFELNNMVNAAFYAAKELYDLEIIPTDEKMSKEIPVFEKNVRTFLVQDAKTKTPIGIFYLDNFARAGKRSGAWMTTYRSQQKLGGVTYTLASNNNNFIPGKPGEKVLISLDDANTLFHEFGHAIHYLLQNVNYPALVETPRDFVEFPSQVNENWLLTREILDKFATHYQTNETMPQELLEKIKNSAKFNSGFSTVEYLSSALLDMYLHNVESPIDNPREFEVSMLKQLNMPAEMVMRHRLSHFNHLFSSDDYSAGYYSYLWSEVMDADTWDAFEKSPRGVWDKDLSSKFKKFILSTGNQTDRASAYREFLNRDPDVTALFERRGFPKE